MKKLCIIILSFVLAATNAFALQKVPDIEGYGTDTRGAYEVLESYEASTIAFVAGTPNTITDSANQFVAEGFVAGDTIVISGTGSNNTIVMADTVVAGTITLVPGTWLSAESGGSFTLTEVPTIFCVDDLTTNNGTPSNDTRDCASYPNGVPVKEGSLREYVNWAKENKIMVMEISGTADYDSGSVDYLIVDDSYQEMWFSTAPSPGFTLKGTGIEVSNATDVYISHIRIRMGDDDCTPVYLNNACIVVGGIGDTTTDIVVDHPSLSWAMDEIFTVWWNGTSNVTFTNGIYSEAINEHAYWEGDTPPNDTDCSNYPGPNDWGFGPTVGSNIENVAILKSLFISNTQRNPHLSKYELLVGNNYIHNWYSSGTGLNDDDSASIKYSIIKNAYDRGPDGNNSNAIFIYDAAPDSCTPGVNCGDVYIFGNYDVDNDDTPDTGTDWDTNNGNGDARLLITDISADKIGNCASAGSPYGCCTGLDTGDCDAEGQHLATSSPMSTTGITFWDADDIWTNMTMGTPTDRSYSIGSRPADRDCPDERVVADVDDGATAEIIDHPDDRLCADDGDSDGWPDLASNYKAIVLPENLHTNAGSGWTNLEVMLQGYNTDIEKRKLPGEAHEYFATAGDIVLRTQDDGTNGNEISVYWRSGNEIDLHSNDYIKLFYRPGATVSNDDGTGVVTIPHNGARAL